MNKIHAKECQLAVQRMWPRSSWSEDRFALFLEDIEKMTVDKHIVLGAIKDHARIRSVSPEYPQLMTAINNGRKRENRRVGQVNIDAAHERQGRLVPSSATQETAMTDLRRQREAGEFEGAFESFYDQNNKPEVFAQLTPTTQAFMRRRWGDKYGTGKGAPTAAESKQAARARQAALEKKRQVGIERRS